ncbi:MAG TPA: MlaD family protein [Vicinamibacteria bacterium]|nr:MlaD family protein [Vicinamibacteria bacterium]
MSARAHPRAVGAFVLGAVALVLGAVLWLSAGDWFKPVDRFVVIFPGSVRGLSRGAPVTFRGVKTGEVKAVDAVLTLQKDPVVIVVTIEIARDVVSAPEGAAKPFASLRGAELAQALVARGLRARLLSSSLLTGQKYIDLDFLPKDPPRFVGVKAPYPELPTTPTAMEKLGAKGERLVEKLAELPLDEMLEDVRLALQSLRRILDSEDLKGAIAGARRATNAVPPTLEDARATLAEARKTLDTVTVEVRDTGAGARDVLGKVREAVDRAEGTLARLEETATGTDEARVAAVQSIEELRQTLRALRNLVEYVQTHPEAVVLGKPSEKEKR